MKKLNSITFHIFFKVLKRILICQMIGVFEPYYVEYPETIIKVNAYRSNYYVDANKDSCKFESILFKLVFLSVNQAIEHNCCSDKLPSHGEINYQYAKIKNQYYETPNFDNEDVFMVKTCFEINQICYKN